MTLESTGSRTDPIGVREMQAMLVPLKALHDARSEAERDALIAEAIVTWGGEFIEVLSYGSNQAPAWSPIRDAAIEQFTRWLGGATLTARADEDERRALAAVAAAERSPALARLAVVALTRLPEQHELRRARLDWARAALRAHLEAEEQDAGSRLHRLASLIEPDDPDDRTDALVGDGEALLARAADDQAVRAFRLSAGHVFTMRALAARDRSDTAEMRALVARARELFDPLTTESAVELDPYANALAALLAELDDDPPSALLCYQRVLATSVTDDRRLVALTGALRTAALVGRHDAIVPLAREALDPLVRRYAEELDPDEVAGHRTALDRALENVTAACAATGEFALLLWAVEVASCARLRQRSAIRRGRAGRRIRRLEADLWSAERRLVDARRARPAVEDGRAARALRTATRLYEAHRLAAQHTRAVLDVPDPREVVATLRRGEGVAVLTTGKWGTAVLLLRPDTDGQSDPLEGSVLEPTRASWASIMATGETTGWAYALGASWEYGVMPGADPRADLTAALTAADAGVGAHLAGWAARHGLRRLWIVPHGILGLVPWWAVPSLRGLDVRHVPALALKPHARGVARLRGPAVVVGDATGDLPAAEAEAAAVAERLRGAGLPTEVLPPEASTEDGIDAAVRGGRLLHFCGHATSDLTTSERSALHVRPASRWSGAAAAAELAALAAGATWITDGDTRTAEVSLSVPGRPTTRGLLREEHLQGDIVVRHLEHGPTGTLLAAYVGGDLRRFAELWSAGDMAVSGALRGLRLAVLSACQSGGGGLAFGSDEFAGLPAAMMLAGVRTVVCTAWPVDDVVAAVISDLFWELVCARTDATIDLYATVGQVRARLAGMSAAEARHRLERLRSAASAGPSRFLLEAAAARLADDDAPPFAHPFDWAPMFVQGEPLVRWDVR